MSVTIKDIYENCKASNVPMLSNYNPTEGFMALYQQNFSRIDKYLSRKYKEYSPVYIAGDVDNTTAEFISDVETYLILHRNSLDHLFKVELAEYDPRYNYDRYEQSETHRNGEVNAAERTDTFTKGSQENQSVFGESENTNTYGEAKMDANGEGAITTFNSTDYVDATKSISESTSYEHIDTQKTEEHTDRHNEGQRIDTNRMGAHTDTTQDSENVSSHIYGNIGTVSTIDLLKQEDNFYSIYSFYDKLFTMIINNLCVLRMVDIMED